MLKQLFGDPNARKLKSYGPIVSDINLFEEDCSKLPIEKKTKYRNASIKAMINTYSADSYFTKKTNRDTRY